MKQGFMSWSGGKDCSLACYRAGKSGIKISHLLNMASEDGEQSRSHGLPAKWLQVQSEAIGIPLVQRRTTDANYEDEFKAAISGIKREGAVAGVFGDIDFEGHYSWVTRVSAEAGVECLLPLWGENQARLVREFIALGFEAVIIATKADMLGPEWLGRKLDDAFLNDLARMPNITPCGETGEYHTLVVNGPFFQKKMEIETGGPVSRGEHWFLDIRNCQIAPK